jgi:hypothetical protein
MEKPSVTKQDDQKKTPAPGPAPGAIRSWGIRGLRHAAVVPAGGDPEPAPSPNVLKTGTLRYAGRVSTSTSRESENRITQALLAEAPRGA